MEQHIQHNQQPAETLVQRVGKPSLTSGSTWGEDRSMGLGKAGRGKREGKKCSNQTKYSSVFKFLSTMSWNWNMTIPYFPSRCIPPPQSQWSCDPTTQT